MCGSKINAFQYQGNLFFAAHFFEGDGPGVSPLTASRGLRSRSGWGGDVTPVWDERQEQ